MTNVLLGDAPIAAIGAERDVTLGADFVFKVGLAMRRCFKALLSIFGWCFAVHLMGISSIHAQQYTCVVDDDGRKLFDDITVQCHVGDALLIVVPFKIRQPTVDISRFCDFSKSIIIFPSRSLNDRDGQTTISCVFAGERAMRND
ncbi:hypothetical protein [Arboricoccus pini]|uniref:hypothetical protein n=1 Tax=Arboricoccus pini TaxID=1963835 RepID=UPI0010555539|nr:hypothetical protein [Arboricoccus pini]